MDFVSHALWGGLSLGRRDRRNFFLSASVSILPDALTEGLFFVLLILGVGGMPGWENGHPNISDYPVFAQTLYNATHSLVVSSFVFALLWVANKRPVWLAAAWGLHILIDIPTHSLALFPTPFLWPISDFKVDGIGWDNPLIMAINIALLLALYSLWLRSKLRRR